MRGLDVGSILDNLRVGDACGYFIGRGSFQLPGCWWDRFLNDLLGSVTARRSVSSRIDVEEEPITEQQRRGDRKGDTQMLY